MRNLKKILALVLALIMSLSLMATAGATDFKDDESIDSYQLAIEVLSGLKVFGGDQNGNFNPKDPIRRSEVAAIIYRIATGDVSGENHKTYGLYNQFKDVQDGDWFAGYVSYCHNAGYIKGHGDGNFKPYDNVTGYQALAMILRAVGYDKNNEFTGDNWQINTASIATQRGVLKGVKSTEDLKAPASRELVAEVLFRSILLDKVQWNALTHSYDTTKDKVANVLGLEEVKGVVMANEYANLEGNNVTAAGTTRFMVNGETTSRSLNTGTQITDVGETRLAYIQGSTVFAMDGEGLNNVKSNAGAKKTLTQVREGIALKEGTTEYFRDFNDTEADKSDVIIRYKISKDEIARLTQSTRELWLAYLEQRENQGYNTGDYYLRWVPSDTTSRRATVETIPATKDEPAYFMVTLQPETVINHIDQAIMQYIFYTANATVNNVNGGDQGRTDDIGEVYVRTTLEEDLSDKMSWNKFVDEYIETRKIKTIDGVGNGDWLKVIDNDNVADYVLWTQFHMDQVVGKYTKSGTEYLEYNHVDLSSGDYTARYVDSTGADVSVDDFSVEDVVLYTLIDGQALISKAESVEATIKTVTYLAKDVDSTTATDTEGNVYTQSDIEADVVTMESLLRNIDKGIAYRLYKDAFGYIRHFEPVGGTKYGLMTELYYGTWRNGRYVVSQDLTAEMKLGDTVPNEYNVTNPIGNDFLLSFNENKADAQNNWLNLNAALNGKAGYITDLYGIKTNSDEETSRNVLQPAIANLADNVTRFAYDRTTGGINNGIWNNQGIFLNARTNVARYIMTDDGVRLIAADEDNGVEYIELACGDKGITAGQKLFRYASRYGTNQSIDATNNTEFYIVADKGISYFKGYSNLPAVLLEKIDINAVYAVAHTTSSDKNRDSYYVADVIVIEAPDYMTKKDGLGLIYNNDSQTDRVRAAGDKSMMALYTGNKEIVQNFTSKSLNWGNQYRGYGFYNFYDTEAGEDGILNVGSIRTIQEDATKTKVFEEFGIFAGTVEEAREIYNSSYIVIDKTGRKPNDAGVSDFTDWKDIGMNSTNTFAILSEKLPKPVPVRVDDDTVPVTGYREYLNAVGKWQDAFEEQLQLHYNNRVLTGDVKAGDRIIWVAGPTGYAIDLDYSRTINGVTYVAPKWLQDLYYEIIAEQNEDTKTETVLGEFYGYEFGLTKDKETFCKKNPVTYGEAKAALKAGESILYLKDMKGYKLDQPWPTAISADEVTYTLTVTVGDKSYEFKLTQEAADKNNTLTADVSDYIESIDGENVITLVDDLVMPLDDFADLLTKDIKKALPKADVEFVFMNSRGVIDKDKWGYSNISGEQISWAVAVISEAGVPNYYYGSKALADKIVVVEKEDGIALPDEDVNVISKAIETNADGDYIITVVTEGNVKPVAVVGDTIYEMKEQTAARAATTTWTLTLKPAQLDGVTVVYIRAILAGDYDVMVKVEKPAETPEQIKQAQDDAKAALKTALDAALEKAANDEQKTAIQNAYDEAVKNVEAAASVAAAKKAGEDGVKAINKEVGVVTYDVTIKENPDVTVIANPDDPTGLEKGAKVELTITVKEPDKKAIDTVKANGTAVPETSGKYVVTVGEEDIEVVITTKDVKPAPPTDPDMPDAVVSGTNVTIYWTPGKNEVNPSEDYIRQELADAGIEGAANATFNNLPSLTAQASTTATIDGTSYTVSLKKCFKVTLDDGVNAIVTKMIKEDATTDADLTLTTSAAAGWYMAKGATGVTTAPSAGFKLATAGTFKLAGAPTANEDYVRAVKVTNTVADTDVKVGSGGAIAAATWYPVGTELNVSEKTPDATGASYKKIATKSGASIFAEALTPSTTAASGTYTVRLADLDTKATPTADDTITIELTKSFKIVFDGKEVTGLKDASAHVAVTGADSTATYMVVVDGKLLNASSSEITLVGAGGALSGSSLSINKSDITAANAGDDGIITIAKAASVTIDGTIATSVEYFDADGEVATYTATADTAFLAAEDTTIGLSSKASTDKAVGCWMVAYVDSAVIPTKVAEPVAGALSGDYTGSYKVGTKDVEFSILKRVPGVTLTKYTVSQDGNGTLTAPSPSAPTGATGYPTVTYYKVTEGGLEDATLASIKTLGASKTAGTYRFVFSLTADDGYYIDGKNFTVTIPADMAPEFEAFTKTEGVNFTSSLGSAEFYLELVIE